MQHKHCLQERRCIGKVVLHRKKCADGEVLLAPRGSTLGVHGKCKRASQSLFDEGYVGVDGINCDGHENLLGLANVDLGNWVRNSAPESHQKAGGPSWSCVQTAQT